jgi:GNAT superfamily N-acetyltransferase
MFVTWHSTITDVVLADKLWSLYEAAYLGAARTVATREMLYRHEFDELLADSSNRNWVLWEDNIPIGYSLVATDIGATRYLSKEYFEYHYPEHSRGNRLRYVMWLVVHPSYEARGAALRLLREGLTHESAQGSLVIFDSPDTIQPNSTGGFASAVERISHRVRPGAAFSELAVSRYFVVDFAPQIEDAADPDRQPLRSAQRS